ncbi:MAG: 4'-phosphopantetheinyl transferase superfamily protein [Chloroflexota bacterium]|nr:MAG: 4'-phosphopantetheinyl transferase superfamily protein [Chloroflexota bacterium]
MPPAAPTRGGGSYFCSAWTSSRFLRMWTRKEAYAKTRGDGIALDFKALDVSAAALASAPLLRPLNDAADTPGWRVPDLDPRDGFVGALAVAVSGAVISTWHFPDGFIDNG